VDVEVGAGVVEEEEDAEEEKEEEGGGGRRRRRTTLIKSNPHLAGGEKRSVVPPHTLICFKRKWSPKNSCHIVKLPNITLHGFVFLSHNSEPSY